MSDHITHPKTKAVRTTQCVGRSLVDLPKGYSPEAGASAAFTPSQDAVESARIGLHGSA